MKIIINIKKDVSYWWGDLIDEVGWNDTEIIEFLQEDIGELLDNAEWTVERINEDKKVSEEVSDSGKELKNDDLRLISMPEMKGECYGT